jgi:hypothetical protein
MERGYASLAPAGARVANLVVLDGAGVFGQPVPERIVTACQAMVKDQGIGILGVDVYQDAAGDWLFAGATPAPWLPAGGEPLLDGLLKTLTATERTGEAQ